MANRSHVVLVGCALWVNACGRTTESTTGDVGGASNVGGAAAATSVGGTGLVSAGAGNLAGGVGGSAVGASGGDAAVAGAGAGRTPDCTDPDYLVCDDVCVDARSDVEHCGSCYTACSATEVCRAATCRAPQSCTQSVSVSGLTDPPRILSGRDGFSLEQMFQGGPATVRVSARRISDGDLPRFNLDLDQQAAGSVPITSSATAIYEFSVEASAGVHTLSFSLGVTGIGAPVVEVTSVEFDDCTDLGATCANGGAFYSNTKSCAPFVCDSADDCGPDFPVASQFVSCEEGACHYAACVATPATPDASYECFSFSDLLDPHAEGHVAFLAGSAASFECPSIESMTWRRDPLRGEGSCAAGPICGPASPSALGFGDASDNRCCYLVARVCGV